MTEKSDNNETISDLNNQYNEEILKQSSTILSDEEINKSKELAGQFNSELSDLSSQIKTAEQQSNSLQEQVQGLNLYFRQISFLR